MLPLDLCGDIPILGIFTLQNCSTDFFLPRDGIHTTPSLEQPNVALVTPSPRRYSHPFCFPGGKAESSGQGSGGHCKAISEAPWPNHHHKFYNFI